MAKKPDPKLNQYREGEEKKEGEASVDKVKIKIAEIGVLVPIEQLSPSGNLNERFYY